MNGCGMGDNGRIARRIRSAAAPAAKTDHPRLRARRLKERSTFDSQFVPAVGQQAASATAIKLAPASIVKSEGPADAAEPEAVIIRSVLNRRPRRTWAPISPGLA